MPKKYIVILIILAIFFGSFFAHRGRLAKRRYADFHCFYTAGQRISLGQAIYRTDDPGGAEFRYTPIIAMLMSGLTLLPEPSADCLWYAFNFFLIIAAFACMKEIVAPDKTGFKDKLLLYLIALFGLVRLIFYNLNAGQSNILMLASAVFGLYYFSKAKEGIGGGWLAFSAMVKYTPLVFLPYFIARKRLKIALFTLIFTAIYLLLPGILIGFKANFAYLKGLEQQLFYSSILKELTIIANKNQSLLSFIWRMFFPCNYYFPNAPLMPFQELQLAPRLLNLFFYALASLLYGLILLPQRKNQKNYNPDFGLLFICVAFFNLNAWVHTYIFLAMGYFVIADYLLRCGFKDKPVLYAWMISAILNNLLTPSVLGKPLMDKVYYYSPFTINGLIIFMILLKIKFSVCQPKKN